jgi:hypothetical protein
MLQLYSDDYMMKNQTSNSMALGKFIPNGKVLPVLNDLSTTP